MFAGRAGARPLFLSAEPAHNERVDASRYAFLPGARPGLTIASTEGAYLIRPDGTRILDASGGAIVASIGHGRREVVEAIAAAAARTTYVVPPFVTPERAALVERLQDRWLPAGLRQCVFASGGSDSVDLALRIVRQHFVARGEAERTRVIGRELSYHGTTLSTLDVGGHTRRKKAFGPEMCTTPKAPACYPLRCDTCAGECNLSCADAFEAAFQAAGPGTVAAVILEPIGGSTAGALVPPEGYLRRVVEIAHRHGALVIADEVMTGFGRTGARFAVDHWGVVPDVLVGGKGLAAGYAPIGGVYTTPAVAEPIAAAGDDVMFYTYSAHPMACAAADQVLSIVEEEGLVERAAKRGVELGARLRDAFGDHPNVAEIRGRGLLQAIELVRDRETLEPFAADDKLTGVVVATGIANRAFFYPGGLGGSAGAAACDVICLGPPFDVTEDQLDQMVDVLARSVDQAVAHVDARRRG